jgi:hypothetical protein
MEHSGLSSYSPSFALISFLIQIIRFWILWHPILFIFHCIIYLVWIVFTFQFLHSSSNWFLLIHCYKPIPIPFTWSIGSFIIPHSSWQGRLGRVLFIVAKSTMLITLKSHWISHFLIFLFNYSSLIKFQIKYQNVVGNLELGICLQNVFKY